MEALFHFQHHTTLNELKDDYQFFTAEGGAKARDGVDVEELRERQRRFVGNFLLAMVRANYRPFSKADYRRAVEQDYLLDVPVEINWNNHDPRLLADFHREADGLDVKEALGIAQDTVAEFLAAPDEIGDNALVFYRGIGRDRTQGASSARS